MHKAWKIMVEPAIGDRLMHLHACPTPESPPSSQATPHRYLSVLKISPRGRYEQPPARALQGPTSPAAADLSPAPSRCPQVGYPAPLPRWECTAGPDPGTSPSSNRSVAWSAASGTAGKRANPNT